MEINATTPEAWGELVEELRNVPARESRAGDMRERRTVTIRSDDPRERYLMRDGAWNLAFQLQEHFAYWMGQNPGHVDRYVDMSQWMVDGELPGSAYGDRLRNTAGHDQLERVEAQLQRSPGTRRAVAQVHQAAEEDYQGPDVSCTSHLHFFVRDGELHLKASLRSQDVFMGYAYDAANNQFLQEVLAGRLGLELGEYHHVMDSAHLYTRFDDDVEEALDRHSAGRTPDMRLGRYDHDEAMGLLSKGLGDARDGEVPTDVIAVLDGVHEAYGDWLRAMTAYEQARFHDDPVRAGNVAAGVETQPWSGWIASYVEQRKTSAGGAAAASDD